LLIIKFYQTDRGRKKVEEFIEGESWEAARGIYERLSILSRFYPDTRGIDVKHLRGKLWELRIKLQDKNYRIVYSVVAGELVILNGFIKKQRREEHEIKIAQKRLKDYLQRLTR
jgi:phage-related protein